MDAAVRRDLVGAYAYPAPGAVDGRIPAQVPHDLDPVADLIHLPDHVKCHGPCDLIDAKAFRRFLDLECQWMDKGCCPVQEVHLPAGRTQPAPPDGNRTLLGRRISRCGTSDHDGRVGLGMV